MQQAFLSRLNFHRSHSHTSDNIESFDRIEEAKSHHHHSHHSPQEVEFHKKEAILNSLRGELLEIAKDPSQFESRICFRKCFKLETKEFIQDCLKHKCNNANFKEAAMALNLVK